MIWIAFAVVFIVALFLLKTKSVFKNEAQQQELTYHNELLGNLVNKDTDRDGIPDWEEGLWGTDPTKKDTDDDGVKDDVEITKMKSASEQNGQGESSLTAGGDGKLTETDKFSRELFSTIAALNQSGAMDQATMEKLGNSLAEQIKNTTQKKIYKLSDLKVGKSNDSLAVKKYTDTLWSLQKKYPVDGSVMDILQEFSADEDNVDVRVLSELDPIAEQTENIITGMVKTSVPQSLASQHLDFINALQRLVENINDIKLYETDAILALSAISQYENNTAVLESAISELSNAINTKLKYNN